MADSEIAELTALNGLKYLVSLLKSAWALPDDCDSGYLQGVVPTLHSYSIDRPWRGVVTRDGWKYTCLEGQPWMLFNLNEDPYEQANLAHNSKYWPERRRLQAELARWIELTGDNFKLPV